MEQPLRGGFNSTGFSHKRWITIRTHASGGGPAGPSTGMSLEKAIADGYTSAVVSSEDRYMTVLVTGAAGFIGYHACAPLLGAAGAPRHPGDGIDTPTPYRAVFSYLDPWVRAFALGEALKKTPIP